MATASTKPILKGINLPFSFTSKGYPEASTDNKTFHDSIYTILSTDVGERVFRPTFGSFLKRLIFEPLNRATAFRVQAEVRRAVAAWEPRVTIETVTFTTGDSTINVNISWTANGSTQSNTIIPIEFGTGA